VLLTIVFQKLKGAQPVVRHPLNCFFFKKTERRELLQARAPRPFSKGLGALNLPGPKAWAFFFSLFIYYNWISLTLLAYFFSISLFNI
jgi:hypothetical protein